MYIGLLLPKSFGGAIFNGIDETITEANERGTVLTTLCVGSWVLVLGAGAG